MTNESFSQLPATVTVDTAMVVQQIKAFDEANHADRELAVLRRREAAEADARIAAREAAAAALRATLRLPDGDIRMDGDHGSGGRVSLARTGPKLTHRYMASAILRDADEPLKAADVISRISDRFGRRIERTSLSPLLAKLLSEGLVEHEGSSWRITEAGSAAVALTEKGRK